MNQNTYAQSILSAVQQQPIGLPAVPFDETKRNNAGRAMTHLLCHRLSANSAPPKHLHHTTYEWQGGVVTIRNARVVDHHWSSIGPSTLDELHKQSEEMPVAYVLTYWALDQAILHVWVLPEELAYPSLSQLTVGKKTGDRTVEVFPGEHHIVGCENSPDLEPFYANVPLTLDEVSKLTEGVKLDEAIKHTAGAKAGAAEGSGPLVEDADEDEEYPVSRYTSSTIAYLKELPEHVEDGEWHERNKKRYEQVLRDPTRELVEQIRTQYIQQLSPEVAGGKRQLSILKKNDYGKGGYYDHYWFAFYDPNAGSKTKSVQLFFVMRGNESVWHYGFAMGNYCGAYLERFHAALGGSVDAVAEYFQQAPKDTIVSVGTEDGEKLSSSEFAGRLKAGGLDSITPLDAAADIEVYQEYPLDSLLNHVDGLVEEVGNFFVWAWPLFQAAITGNWQASPKGEKETGKTVEVGEVDEEAPATLEELCEVTSLPHGFLQDLQEALIAKQQVVLVGPPGTSKTFIAQQFARYFVRQRPGQMQGVCHTLYMHANWSYEDFFEGVKPVTKDGVLLFESKRGFFLEWVTDDLKGYNPSARHVLVLDEINRCDTAAVLGELLQLLEYRGTTVKLLSSRQFVFPKRLYIIGTMNSADRSIGRLDLALRRRFLWLDLYPQPDTLRRWLERPGNNPVGFDAATLEECNHRLADRGIPREQHIGHALFMAQQRESEDDLPHDLPLTEKQLKRIVKFSIIPYLQELLVSQLGQVDHELCDFVQGTLFHCLATPGTSVPP
jgi:MoxR-like ATPase